MSDKDLRVAFREALLAALSEVLLDPYDPYSLDVKAVTYRPTRAPILLNAVTFYDTGVKVDEQVPLYERTLHVDIWTRSDLDQGELIAHKVNEVLDHQELALDGDEGLVAFLMLESDQDQPQNDADLSRKMLTYRIMEYEYNGPQYPRGDSDG